MFTLSDKQRVLNTPASVKVFSPANSERTTSAAIAAGDKLLIEGFGHFDIDSITDIKCKRARVAANESLDFTVVAPTGVAIGDVIEVKIEMSTSRYQSELFVHDKLGGSKPMVFTTAPLTAVTAAAIATAIAAGYTAFNNTFPKGNYPVVVSNPSSAVVRTVTASGYESVKVESFSIRRANQGIGTQTFFKLAIAATNTVGFEGENLGKFLEESIRMATPGNTDPYGVDNNETQVDVRGAYTAVYFTVSAPFTENLSTLAADHGPLPASHQFVIYLNESTCMAANSAAAKLAAIALLRATALATLTATLTAAPLSLAAEKSEVMILADASSVATVAAFIA
jgi:hypothetical protein